jgi:hypothetical protein
MPAAPICHVEDMDDLWEDHAREKINGMIAKAAATGKRLHFDEFRPLIQDAERTIRKSVKCTKCKKPCRLLRAKSHWGGPACINFSTSGKREGLCGGETRHLAAFLAHRRVLQEPVVIVEQSDKFPGFKLCVEMLGDLYCVQGDIAEAEDFGNFSRRSRWWGVLLHRRQVVEIYSRLSNIIPLFHRTRTVAWPAILIAEDSEISRELETAAKRRQSKAYQQNFDEFVLKSPHPHRAVLTEKEDINRQWYAAKAPHCVGLLNQATDKGFNMYGTPHTIQTIIHNAAFNWCLDQERWLSGEETLMAQMIPTRMWMSNPGGSGLHRVSSFQPHPEGGRTLLDRGSRTLKGFAGNAMNVGVAGAHWAYLCYIKIDVAEFDNFFTTPLPPAPSVPCCTRAECGCRSCATSKFAKAIMGNKPVPSTGSASF